MYSHKKAISRSMQEVIDITARRRKLQDDYNKSHWITPKTVFSKIKELAMTQKKTRDNEAWEKLSSKIRRLELEMDVAAANLEFEKAAEIRDYLLELKKGKK